MVPTKSTSSSSRRSSILKTPKPRQPLQNLNFDKSSNESSPATVTTKIKRRVSFAEKKHVKEFCNSVDQGTVWDNTYEEHDLSSFVKVPCGSNEQQFGDNNVYKESISIHREASNVQFSCNDSVKEGVNIEQINLYVKDVVEDTRYQSEVGGATLPDRSRDVQENENVCSIDLQLKSNTCISRSISVYEDGAAGMLSEAVELSQSRVHNFVCNKISSKFVQGKFMEFTQGTCNNEYSDVNCIENNRTEDAVKDKSINVQKLDTVGADVVQDISMEFTTIASTNGKSNAERDVDRNRDETKRIDTSMEITAALPSVPCILQSDYNEMNCRSTNLLPEDKENRTIVLNDSMEFTEVPQKLQRSTVIQKTPLNKYNNLAQDEITKILNMSMEMTQAVPVNVNFMIKNRDRSEASFSNNFKKLKYDPEVYDTVKFDETTYCSDESMEFTTVVTTSPKSTEETNLELPNKDTQRLCALIAVDSDEIKPASEKTVVFPNTSMEITEAVIRGRNFTPMEDLMRCANFVSEAARTSVPQVNLQKSMEITEAVRGIRAPDEIDLLKSMELTEAVRKVQPLVESDLLLKSMEITEAVPRLRTLIREDPQQSMELTEAVRRVQPHVESNLLLKSMEFTEAVPRSQTLTREEELQKSMEFTEAIKRVQPHVESDLLLKSMEFTEAVPRPQTFTREEDPQKSMEITEAVRRVEPYVEPATLLKSMEITEAVPQLQTFTQEEDPQKSMEFTEAVPRPQTFTREEDLQKSMEITEVATRLRTLIREEDLQKSMEFTEAVPRPQTFTREEDLQKSMEITEVATRLRTLIRQEDPQKSMEITEAVPRPQTFTREEDLQKSMEITEVATRLRTLIREEDLQKSMEITEAVPRPQTFTREEDLQKSMEITEAVTRLRTLIREEDPQKSIEITEAVRRVEPYAESELLLKSMEITEAVRRVEPHVEPETQLKSMEIIEDPISVETRVQEEDLQKSMEIVESVIPERSPVRTKDADLNLPTIERPLEMTATRGLTDVSNFEENNATNFDAISNKQNCNVYKNLENDVAEKSASIEIQTFANNKPSMALHESMQLENCASALKTSNADVACAALNSASSANSEIMIPELTLTKSSKRRTYVIKPLINNRTFTVNSSRNSTNAEIDSDINIKETSVSQGDIQNSQNDEDYDIENSKVFITSNFEDIESIKQPSFTCLNDLSDTPMDINEGEEMQEVISLPKDNDNDHEDASKVEHQGANVLENMSQLQTFSIKNASASNALDSSKIEQEIRLTEVDIIQKPQLLDNGDNNADIQALECSSSAINSNEKSPPNREQNLRPSCTLNSKLENRNEIRTSPKIIAMHESESKESNDEPYEADDEHPPHSLFVEENVIRKLKVCAKSDDIIWEVFYEDLDQKKLFVIGFISCSLLVVIYLQERCNFRSIKEIKLISRLPEDADVLISMVHRLLIEKIDTAQLLSRFSVYDDILPLLDYISKEVKVVMDFMFDLKRLESLNLMEFTRDSVSFVSRTDRRNIILKVTVNIRPFEKIGPEDVSVHSLFGSLRDNNGLKKLITNVKRDHKFLRRFIQDVNSYICIEEDFLSQM